MTRLSVVVITLLIATGTATAQKDDRVAREALEHVDIDVEAYMRGAESVFDRIEAASPVLSDVARGALRRARRKVSIGPTLGLFGSYGDSADAALTFGLGVEVFKIPVLPTVENLQAIVKERAKAKLAQALVDAARGQAPDQAQFEQLAAEAWREAVAEVLGMENIRAKTMERPLLTVALEANRYFDAAAWATRLRLGAGVWKLTVAASVGAAFTDPKASVFVGPELVVHFLTSKGGRASVLDVFARADLEVRNRGEVYAQDMYSLGVRYLLDVL
jgi:hypothetical protein